jgi:hypothetical protein
LIGLSGEVLATESTRRNPQSGALEPKTVWQFNNLDGTRFVDSGSWVASDYAFAGQKLQSAATDSLIQSRDAARSTWGGGVQGSVAWAATSAFVGSIGSSLYRQGNGLAQMGANAIDTGMIAVNTVTTLAGLDWQYQAIGTLGSAVERGEVSTGDIAWGVGAGVFTAAADTVSLGGYAAYQYANGQITAEEAGDRFLGVGLSALGGAGTLRAAGLANVTVTQAAAATGRTAANAARTVGTAAANAGRTVARVARQIELNPGALTQFNSGIPTNLIRWKQTGNPMATIAEGYGFAIESRVVASTKVTPSSVGARSIIEDARLHRFWEDSMRDLYNGSGVRGKALRDFLDVIEAGGTPTAAQARIAYRSVRASFDRRVKAAFQAGEAFPGYSFECIHHWNWHMADHSFHALDPRQLFPVTQDLHDLIHLRTTIGPVVDPLDIYFQPINPLHRMDLDFSYPLSPR